MTLNQEFLNFDEQDEVLDEFVNKTKHQNRSRHIISVEKIEVDGVEKIVVNKMKYKNKQYYITVHDKNSKGKMDVYIKENDKFVMPSEKDEIRKLVDKIVKDNEKQKRRYLGSDENPFHDIR